MTFSAPIAAAARPTTRFKRATVTVLAAAGLAGAALTFAPSPAQAAEPAAAPKAASAVSAQKGTGGGNVDAWINEALKVMKAKGIPGSYEGLHRNIMRESSGNPNAVNGYDVNAVKGTPSKGLLQVIQPTFDAYHVAGTSNSLTDPVANITAAANYAADRYGSIDNVNSAY
ncbi:transglycosylase SLT domain-containing protein [Streptomyces sp. NPDC057888]|uniref:transglycosylase SLT domain-containing protein n=1 Tax=Streptomyces sp. NPDC057888 TaxID=3346271 RepID=UPI0036D0B207